MSVKRPLLDLKALTAEQAAPMAEAVQRAARAIEPTASVGTRPRLVPAPTPNLEALAFKVSPAFRRRFRSRAAAADLKMNELLFEALDAWEEKRGIKM
jgi:hypothetical protein